jgi:hypothetical protein
MDVQSRMIPMMFKPRDDSLSVVVLLDQPALEVIVLCLNPDEQDEAAFRALGLCRAPFT